jgi:NADPH:quinone reductase-like Zn-dependent oxidoreductase
MRARFSGGYAEYCVAPVPQCLPVPRGFDMTVAAAIPETFFTVWTNVFDRGRLAAGESILVHGGSSGIGTTAIQLARARGARVFATAGSAEKCAACERLGASAPSTIARPTSSRPSASWHGRGVDVVLDMVGGDYFPRNIEALAMEGRLVRSRRCMARSRDQHHDDHTAASAITGSTLRLGRWPRRAPWPPPC